MDFWGFTVRDLRPFSWVVIIVSLFTLSVSGRPQASSQTKSLNNKMCGMCHTPRTDSGELDTSHSLDGASVWLLPAHPTENWPLKAPRIAGTPPASDEDMIRLLTTGVWTDGSHLRPPMPQFRMSREDAGAVVAYLRSLTPRAGD